MISKSIKNPSFNIILAFFTLSSIIVNYFFSIRFEENDDIAMLLISSGEYSGTIDNHLVYINFIFGSLLNTFYSFLPGLEWYSIAFVALNTLSISLIAKVIFRSSYSAIFKATLLIFLFSIFINFSVILQFTRTAAILSIAGLSVIYNSKHKYVGALIFILGSLIRFEMTILILVISFPLILISTINIKDYFFNKNFRIIAFTVFISFFCKIADYAYYNMDSEWKSYMEFNKLRGKINDNPNVVYNNLNLPDNISLENYHLLINAHTNPIAISYVELEQIYQTIDEKSFWEKTSNIKKITKHYGHVLLIILVITLLLLYQNKEQRFKILLTLLIFVGLLAYISIDSTLKGRIVYPALYSAFLVLIYLNNNRTTGFINLMIASLVLCYSGDLLHTSYKLQEKNKSLSDKFKKHTELINEHLNRDNTLIPIGAAYRIAHNNPFSVSSTFPSQKILFSGWLTNSPFNKDKFDSFKYYIDGYSLLVKPGSAQACSVLIKSSILQETNIDVFPKTVLNKHKISIVEFLTDSTKTNVGEE